ncbi:MAG: hypothetical protein AAGF20_07660 [Pseudomonadota bacterium]
MPWQKGQSGNPGGVSRASVEIKAKAQALGDDCVEFLQAVMRGEPWPPVKADPEAAYPWKPETRVSACKELLDRGFGKPKAPIEVGPPDYDAMEEGDLVQHILQLTADSAADMPPDERARWAAAYAKIFTGAEGNA